MINLVRLDGGAAGRAIVLRKLSGAKVSVEVVSLLDDTWVGLVGETSLIALAGALAKKSDLTIETREGHYNFRRRRSYVEIDWVGAEPETWKLSMSSLLKALQELGSRAA